MLGNGSGLLQHHVLGRYVDIGGYFLEDLQEPLSNVELSQQEICTWVRDVRDEECSRFPFIEEGHFRGFEYVQSPVNVHHIFPETLFKQGFLPCGLKNTSLNLITVDRTLHTRFHNKMKSVSGQVLLSNGIKSMEADKYGPVYCLLEDVPALERFGLYSSFMFYISVIRTYEYIHSVPPEVIEEDFGIRVCLPDLINITSHLFSQLCRTEWQFVQDYYDYCGVFVNGNVSV